MPLVGQGDRIGGAADIPNLGACCHELTMSVVVVRKPNGVINPVVLSGRLTPISVVICALVFCANAGWSSAKLNAKPAKNRFISATLAHRRKLRSRAARPRVGHCRIVLGWQ
jgi:hypothetical protein